jgi:L-threonylcarbamoyladenylate synthase
VIVHVAPGADIRYWAKDIPHEADQLIAAFWPGPLTLILKRADHIPDAVSGGQDTVGIRCPSHPVAQQLLLAFKNGKGGVAAPSANKFGHVSPTLAQHVAEEFAQEILPGGLIAAVLDGGQSEVGIESTIVDLSRSGNAWPGIAAPGADQFCPTSRRARRDTCQPDAAAPRASGTLDAHYAPQTPVVQVALAELDNVAAQLQAKGKTIALLSYQSHPGIVALAVRQLPADAAGYAHDLYAGLRELDHAHADLILAEAIPQDKEWLA